MHETTLTTYYPYKQNFKYRGVCNKKGIYRETSVVYVVFANNSLKCLAMTDHLKPHILRGVKL